MRKVIADFNRKELFLHYHSNTNPFAFVTVPINITNLYQYCKEHKHFYATFGYLIAKTVNEVPNFRYRYENNNFVFYDKINPNFTNMIDENHIGFFEVPFCENIDEFTKNYDLKDKYLKDTKKSQESDNQGVIWLSCEPWFSASSLIPPFHHDLTIPQFIWDKIVQKGNHYFVNLMIMVHHGFADGYHINIFIDTLTKNISTLK